MTEQTDLAARYGAPSPARRRWFIGATVMLAAAFLGWLGWAVWAQSTPQVQSSLVGYDVVDAHTTTAQIDVHLDDPGVVATCTLRASAEDHTVVGELSFTPVAGRSEETIRTERLATSVELVGCTTPDQDRPR